MTGDRRSKGQIGGATRGWGRRQEPAILLALCVLLGSVVTVRGAAAAEQSGPPRPERTATAGDPQDPFPLKLDRTLDGLSRADSAFDLSLRGKALSGHVVRPDNADQREPAAAEAPSAAVGRQPRLTLGLDPALGETWAKHSEFNPSFRREIWSDPMVRLGFALSREEAAARQGGLVGYPVLFVTAGGLQVPAAPGDLRLVLSGPLARDWHDLSPEEKFGRMTETVVYYGLLFELARSLSGHRH
jgi:hypothetical protein